MVGVIALASMLPATGSIATGLGVFTKIAIGAVFFLHGARLPREAVVAGLTHWRLHLLVLASTFVMFPLLCLGLAALPGSITPPAMAAGLIFLGCLPSTVQASISMTILARGNAAAAVAAASASNIFGVFATPALVAVLLHAQGSVSPEALQSIFIQLLAPFLAGQVLRRWISGWIAHNARLLSMMDRGAILLVVYVAFSGAVAAGVWSRLSAADLIRLLLLCGALLAVVLGVMRLAARRLGFSKEDEIAILFCGSKKSLASGAPMAAILFPAATAGMVLIPVMVFHQMQLMVCAAIAARYARRADPASV